MNWRWTQVADWLTDPKYGAEIGVKEGRFVAHMLNTFPNLTMYTVDPWENQPGANEDYIGWEWNSIYKQYRDKIKPHAHRVIELREYSDTAHRHVLDGSLDFVFIDAQHDYDSVRRDILFWKQKVKPGGLLSGHDYDNNFPGVRHAVDEAFPDRFIGTNAVWGVWC